MSRLSNRRRKEIGKLTQRKYRKRMCQSLVEGRRAFASAVAGGAPLVDVLVTAEAGDDDELADLLRRLDVPVYEVEDSELDSLTSVRTHQGVLAVVERKVLGLERLATEQAVLVLDGVQDPGNVGTLLRAAAWFGVEAVLGCQGTAGFYGPKVMRAGMGAHWDLDLARADETAAALEFFQTEGFAVYGADLQGTPVRQWVPDDRSVLVLGSEAHGLTLAAGEHLTGRVSIPALRASGGGTESLNVAVSGGILLYEWAAREAPRQRRPQIT